MYSLQRRLRIPVLMTLLAAGLTWAGSARANVYASNIKINGNITNSVSVGQGSSVAISYILNEAATAGVTISISSSGTPVRTITIASGTGTAKGLNTVSWDGKDGGGNNVATGVYGVSITAAANGFSDWTVTSDGTSPNTHVNRPYGIAVDNNTNSPYYGRIFIGNVHTLTGSSAIGDTIGIVKCNADGSYADDGAFSQFDYNFAGSDDGLDCPIGMKVLADDTLYFNDWAIGKGKVVGVDPALTHSFVVWDSPNYANTPVVGANGTHANFVDFDIAFVGTDHPFLFAADANFASDGVYGWHLTNNAGHLFADPALIITNEDGSTQYDGTIGQQVIQTGGDLALRADGIVCDVNTNLFVCENRANPTDPAMRAAMFANWNGVDDLFIGATWVVGGGDSTFRSARGGALDSRITPTKWAIPEYTTSGVSADVNGWKAGGIRILSPVDGSTIYTNLFATNLYRGVSWDNVGNLYAGTSGTEGGIMSRWQAISPPGANQATTAALASIQVTGAVTVPHITSVTVTGGNVSISFTAGAGDSATAFTLLSAGVVTGPFNPVAVSATQTSPGVFNFTTPVFGGAQFYRISR